MDYRKFGDSIVIRMDRGEEVLEQLKAVCEKEGVKLASVSALGATDDFTVGVFDLKEKQYRTHRFTGDFEILSLLGTVTTQNGAVYPHLHLCAAGEGGRTCGGHLLSAHISITCEMVLQLIDGTVERRHDEALGVNLFDFR